MIFDSIIERLRAESIKLLQSDLSYNNWIYKNHFDDTEDLRMIFLLTIACHVLECFIQTDDDTDIKNTLNICIDKANVFKYGIQNKNIVAPSDEDYGKYVYSAVEEIISKFYLECIKLPKIFVGDTKLLLNTFCRVTDNMPIKVRYTNLARNIISQTTNSVLNSEMLFTVARNYIAHGKCFDENNSYYDFLFAILYIIANGFDSTIYSLRLIKSALDTELRESITEEIANNKEYKMLYNNVSTACPVNLDYKTYSGDSFRRLLSTLRNIQQSESILPPQLSDKKENKTGNDRKGSSNIDLSKIIPDDFFDNDQYISMTEEAHNCRTLKEKYRNISKLRILTNNVSFQNKYISYNEHTLKCFVLALTGRCVEPEYKFEPIHVNTTQGVNAIKIIFSKLCTIGNISNLYLLFVDPHIKDPQKPQWHSLDYSSKRIFNNKYATEIDCLFAEKRNQI